MELVQQKTAPGSWHPISQFEIDRLKKAGLTDPIPQLISSLRESPGVIPIDGLHGRTMAFYDTSRIRVMNERWVYATFDDGHIGGCGIFEFSISDSAPISWTAVTATQD